MTVYPQTEQVNAFVVTNSRLGRAGIQGGKLTLHPTR